MVCYLLCRRNRKISEKTVEQRKLSVKGTIRRTRNINKDPRKLFTDSPSVSVTPDDENISRETVEKESDYPTEVHRVPSDNLYEKTETMELVHMLRETDNLEEQGDILHFLVVSLGLQAPIGEMNDNNQPVTVKDLLKELYDKACHNKQWALVRHTAGTLGKRVEDLAKAVTDLLVRQKQVTIGMPPNSEKTITRPLPSLELRKLIHDVYGEDESSAMLTQELLVYLAMFIRTEPQLFSEMLRLRIGLIIQVMADELKRSLHCTVEEASEHLLNLSPFEMKNLLHHIMSGKEFGVGSARSGALSVITQPTKVSHGHKSKMSFLAKEGDRESVQKFDKEHWNIDRQGQWIRRRRLDGALNRVPRHFYSQTWLLLEKCQGLAIEGRVLPQSLCKEMTPGELKFALHVEQVLNTIQQPEYRQLIVEAIMVLILVVEHNTTKSVGGIINVEQIVHKANIIFLDEQRNIDGDATICCASRQGEASTPCKGAAYICQHFYDSAPSGSFGTLSYMIRSVGSTLDSLPKDGEIDCTVS